MRRVLLPVMCLSLLAGCSLVERVQKFGPYRVNVQQGNALDAESVARLKPGMSRSQVRFLLGTPLVVDPFRNDRWDYVYVYYEAGSLVEQKRISLFFEGDTLARIEGDMPAPPAPTSDVPGTTSSVEPQSPAVPVATPVPQSPGVQP